MITKTLMFIFRQSATRNTIAKEALDALLAAAAFEQKVQVVFMGDAVWQLQSGMDPKQLALPPVSKQLAALPMYDIDTLYVHQPSAMQRGAKINLENTQFIDDTQLSSMINSADHVMTF